jgi:mRNA interferase YafQ
MSLLVECLVIMCSGAKLPDKYKDHSLEGEWRGHRELHLEFDWLLVYRADGDKLYLERLGRHSDIFKN